MFDIFKYDIEIDPIHTSKFVHVYKGTCYVKDKCFDIVLKNIKKIFSKSQIVNMF